MKSNSVIIEKPPTNDIALEDCDFQHAIDIPGVSSEYRQLSKLYTVCVLFSILKLRRNNFQISGRTHFFVYHSYYIM